MWRVGEQFGSQFCESFSQWMCRHPPVYRLLQLSDVVERSAPLCRLLTTEQRVLVRADVRLSVYLSVALTKHTPGP